MSHHNSPTIPLQARPVATRVNWLRVDGKLVTAIARQWGDGDTGHAGRCHLCPACGARENLCLLLVDGYVPREEAPLFTIRNHDIQTPGEAW
ncbi:hypothetical protein [Singulisphaera sp. PoT]|uniref:hypothetical protein n=1 Tax=Singulisphaera sp. PoT TaxID=3411797 RepID=UPI003BF4E0AC